MSRYIELVIEVEAGGVERRPVSLPASGAPFTIGSSTDCDVSLDAPIDPLQCRLALVGDEVELVSLGAETHLRLNGVELTGSKRVDHGDEIEFGACKMTLDFDAAPVPAQPPAAEARTPPIPPERAEPEPAATVHEQREAPAPPPVAPVEPPAPEPPAAAPVDGPAAAFADRLSAEFPEQARRLGASGIDGRVERGVAQAQKYGFVTDDHLLQFLRLVVMLDDDLAGRETNAPEVWFALTNARKPPEERLDRALKMARRALERSPAPSPPFSAAVAPSPSDAPSGPSTGPSTGAIPTAPDAQPAAPSAGEPVTADRSVADVEERKIEGFRTISLIGIGEMGPVYRARFQNLDVDVALRLLRPKHPDDHDRFERDAKAAVRLRHPNIVRVYQCDDCEDEWCYVMELVDGTDGEKIVAALREQDGWREPGDHLTPIVGIDPECAATELRELLATETPYFRLVAWWMAGVADGLALAHREGVVHSDVRPYNVMVGSDGVAKLSGFGIAVRREGIGGWSSPRIGTPRYLAPERIADWACGRNDGDDDRRSDVWGLGATLYEFLALSAPYDGADDAVLRDIVARDPEPPAARVAGVPEELGRICMKAMARRPDDRYGRADEVVDELRAWLAG